MNDDPNTDFSLSDLTEFLMTRDVMKTQRTLVRRVMWFLLIAGILLLIISIIFFARGSFLFTDYFFASLAA
jgi:uncharacterized integral membrane protein